VLVHAVPSINAEPGVDDYSKQLAEQAKSELLRLLRESEAEAEILMAAGDPPKAVCDATAKANADLLVIGRGSAAGVFGRLRANAYAIIRQSPCPVVSV
jgi:nucleotide-binding universal stress UspA family protein